MREEIPKTMPIKEVLDKAQAYVNKGGCVHFEAEGDRIFMVSTTCQTEKIRYRGGETLQPLE